MLLFSDRRRAVLLVCGLLLGATVLPARTSYAAGPPQIPVLLRPSDARAGEVSGPGYFAVSADPGATVQLYAFVANKGRVRAGIDLVPVDATSGVYGAISYNLPEQRRTRVGAWVHLSRRWVQLGSNRGTVVAFSLHIPHRINPGQYIGALTAFVPAPALEAHRGVGIRLQTRVFNAIVVTVPGPTHASFTILGVTPQLESNELYVMVHVRNSGNVLLKGQGYLWVYAPWSKKPWIYTRISLDTTVPHTTVHYPIHWAKRVPRARYRFAVRISWQGGTSSSAGVQNLVRWTAGTSQLRGFFWVH